MFLVHKEVNGNDYTDYKILYGEQYALYAVRDFLHDFIDFGYYLIIYRIHDSCLKVFNLFIDFREDFRIFCKNFAYPLFKVVDVGVYIAYNSFDTSCYLWNNQRTEGKKHSEEDNYSNHDRNYSCQLTFLLFPFGDFPKTLFNPHHNRVKQIRYDESPYNRRGDRADFIDYIADNGEIKDNSVNQ